MPIIILLGEITETLRDRLSSGGPGTDCLIAKVDGPGQVDLPRILENFGPPIFIYVYICLHMFYHFLDLKLIAYQLSVLDPKKFEKYAKICKNI